MKNQIIQSIDVSNSYSHTYSLNGMSRNPV